MKILVTGANGYLGQGIVRTLLDAKFEVIATDFSIEKIDERAVGYACNLFEVGDPYNAFERPDIVLHLAWRDGFNHFSESHIVDLPKHYVFLQKLFQSNIQKIVVMGTMHEIGFHEGSINEDTPCNPENFYGIAKNALREATFVMGKQNNKIVQWLRGYYIVGHTKFGGSIFSKIVAASQEGKRDFPFTTGLNQYDFIDYNEFCKQVVDVISQSDVNGIINICSGRPEKLADRVERFIKEGEYNINLLYGRFPERPYDSKAVWGNNDKILKIRCSKQI